MKHMSLLLAMAMGATANASFSAETTTPLPDPRGVLERIHMQMCAHDDAGALATASILKNQPTILVNMS